jgi:hypothetical protein
MKVDGSLKSLLQGVSQQPPRDRLAGQCTEQINMNADPIDGLTSRPPSDLVGIVAAYGASPVVAWHDFQMQDGNKFCMHVRANGAVGVRDLNSVNKTVVSTSGAAYLATAGLLRFYTDEDENQTIIVNTGVVPAMLSSVKSYANAGAGKPNMAILQVLGGQYNRKYAVNINGVEVGSYKPPSGTTATDIDKVRTTAIAARVKEALTITAGTTTPDGATSSLVSTAHMASAPWTVTVFQDVILISNSTTEFDITVSDDAGNVNFKAMGQQVSDAADLPRIAPMGYVARIATEVDPEKDLWLQFVTEIATTLGAGFGKAGYWTECVKPGITYAIDPATMPHMLTYDAGTATFTLNQGVWSDRTVGTLVSNPNPSFIGLPINDVSAIQSRLVFVAGKNFITSRTNDSSGFWRGSAAAKADTDPIDIASTSEKGSLLSSITAHNKDLVIFARGGGQFIVSGRSALTPDNAALIPATEYETQLDASPTGSGKVVFAATEFGRFTGIREFFTTNSNDAQLDARPITDHIKKYIIGKAKTIIANANQGMMIVRTDADATNAYVYQYIWNGEDKVQSAWGKWVFAKNVSYMFFANDRIYFVEEVEGAHYLHRMILDTLDETDIDFPVQLDSRFDVLNVDTQFLLPYDWMFDQQLVVVQGLDCPNPGMIVPISSIVYSVPLVGYVVTLAHAMLGGDVVCGVKYLRWYEPTMPLVKDQDGVVVASGKLKVKNFVISLLQTGYIVAQMITRWGNGPPLAYNGRIVGSIESVVGEIALSDSDFVMPFRERTDRGTIVIYSDSYLPMSILDVDWQGQYQKRGKRISTGG